MLRASSIVLAISASLLISCADDMSPDSQGDQDDLPIGDISADDGKADGFWGHATECKDIPDLPHLADPAIIISIDGMTLRLVDRAGSYDKTFPVGVGAIDTKTTSPTYQESLSYYPLWRDRTQDFTIDTTNNWSFNPCRVWWTDTDTGERLPVFAGMPFMRWRGSYGIHGPITNYRAANGGRLERGYVSHGCIRMESADVVEVYARISGTRKVPVHVQREPERLSSGARTDEPDRWIGSECQSDDECNFDDDAFCKQNQLSGRGWCTVRCDRFCDDRYGRPTTFCVSDPDDSSRGICMVKENAKNSECRPYDHFVPAVRTRHNQSSRSATVCVPGSRGWIGDRCMANDDCQTGNRCDRSGDGAGQCTQDCSRFCPDSPGFATTFCASPDEGDSSRCLRQCTPSSNASECAAGSSCVERARAGQASRTAYVCVQDS